MSTPERYRAVRQDGTPVDLADLAGPPGPDGPPGAGVTTFFTGSKLKETAVPDSVRLGLAGTVDALVVGTITRDANGAATAAAVKWPDGTPGQYTATTVSAAFPGAVDAYTITYGSPATATYTQPAVTRDPSTGAVTERPAITVTTA